ncbi:oligosaccharide flippase family protein [Actimicrobium sp. CCI2.3]|uniref:oligosaccharide flippase family protein n=1 Tax=Actimicrobium sp. CCI2.3 TaxID=3048616 RepID=UPI002B2403EC|nr:oligosaccharide flippase family protein [Actimicrobium sp. CCI2.3]MEB0021256.1 oligosaccharide flippase family protein [Actimicrobium sp. CCI2.3]
MFNGISIQGGKTVWSMADNFAQQALSFVIFAILARWLTPHEFGLLAIAHLMVQFSRLAVLDAMAMPVVRSVGTDDSLFDWLFTLCTSVSAILSGLMAMSSSLLANFFEAPDLTPVLLGMSLVILLFGLSRAHEARLLRDGNFRLLAIRSISSVSIGGVVAMYLAFQGKGALALVAQQITTTTIGLIIAVISEWKIWRPKLKWSMVLVRQHASEMGKVGSAGILNYANNSGDTALVSILLGPGATGLYNLAKRILSAAFLIVGASLSRVSISIFIKQQSDIEALGNTFKRFLNLILLLLVPIYAITTILAEPLVVIIFGEQWRSSAPLFVWMSLIYLCQAVFGLGQSLCFSTGESKLPPKLALMQLCISCGAAVLFTNWYGVTGIAIGFSAGSIIGMSMMVVAISRQLNLPLLNILTTSMPALLSGFISIIVIYILEFSGLNVINWKTLIIASIVGVVTYSLSTGFFIIGQKISKRYFH